MFILSAVVVVLITLVVIIYFVTDRLVRPLREMVDATQSFSKGDFSVRVPVERYDEIGKLAMAFNNMATNLASQETMRRSFIANVSHELKTPMTTIGGFIDGILDGTIPPGEAGPLPRDRLGGGQAPLPAGALDAQHRADRGGRDEAGATDFDINDIVCQTVFTFEQPIEQKRLEMRGLDAGKFMVDADPDLIHQVVYNLMDNAVKFANEGGYIEVNYTQEDGRIFVGIRNSGEGSPRRRCPRCSTASTRPTVPQPG